MAAQPPLDAAPAAPDANAVLNSLTPEERVNVLVYQQVNRSVVNINTKSVSGNAIPLFEIISEGEENSLAKLITWCRKGPEGANVERLDVEWEEPSNLSRGFSILY